MNRQMNERINGNVRGSPTRNGGKYKTNPRDTFLMTNRRRQWGWKSVGREGRKNQAPHVPRLCSVVAVSPGCIHILGGPLCHDFDSAASKSTQVDAMRCDATRLKSSRVILHLKCRQRVLLSQRQGLLPRLPNRQLAYAHTKTRRKRRSHWPNWLRDREFLTENRSTFIFCLFDTFATFLLTVLRGAGE